MYTRTNANSDVYNVRYSLVLRYYPEDSTSHLLKLHPGQKFKQLRVTKICENRGVSDYNAVSSTTCRIAWGVYLAR